MSILYNALLSTASGFVKLAGRGGKNVPKSKFKRFASGQRVVFEKLKAASSTLDENKKTVWFHAASLGEYAICRPLIEALKKRGDTNVVMTFFSPSGYENVAGKDKLPDVVSYLPLDTKRNVKRFLDIVKPCAAVFAVSEYWYNYISELYRREIPSYLVSAKINEKSVFFKWYGSLHRRCMKSYSRVFVLDETSKKLVEKLECHNVEVSGNPLFDNAILKSREPWRDEKIERFLSGSTDVMIGGSIHDENDIELITRLANNYKETKFIIVPHETDDKFVAALESALQGKVTRYSSFDGPVEDSQILIVDVVGKLAYIYRYGFYAYVGGGFTPYLHSLIEATVYGLPVAFGPQIQRKITPRQLMDAGIGQMVSNADELQSWFDGLKGNSAELNRIKSTAKAYVMRNADATALLIKKMEL